jgi:hypothetical protein
MIGGENEGYKRKITWIEHIGRKLMTLRIKLLPHLKKKKYFLFMISFHELFHNLQMGPTLFYSLWSYSNGWYQLKYVLQTEDETLKTAC